MKLLILVSSLLAAQTAFSHTEGSVTILGNCLVDSGVTKSFEVTSDKIEKLVLGYVGVDGGRYKITIANNGSLVTPGSFEIESGAIQVGFSRDEPSLRGPLELCPTRPEVLKKECEARNAANHPPFKPASDVSFEKQINDNGEADAEMNDDFDFLKVVVSGKKIQGNAATLIQTPIFNLGGVDSACFLTATRNNNSH